MAELRYTTKPLPDTLRNMEFPLVGISFYDGSDDYLYNTVGGTSVYLMRDETNRYDSNATGIFIKTVPNKLLTDIKQDYKQIGWVSKKHNANLAKHFQFSNILIARAVISHNKLYRSNRELEDLYNSHGYDNLVQIRLSEDTITKIAWDNYKKEMKYEELYGKAQPTKITKEDLLEERIRDHAVDALKYTTTNLASEVYLKSALKPTTEKSIMSKITDQLVHTNTQAATQAAFLEAGRIANNQAVKLAAKHLPIMVRGYAETPVGKLVLANIVKTAINYFKPTNAKLQKLADAMVTAAYQEVYQSFDIEAFIEETISTGPIKNALDKLNDSKE